VVRCPLWGGQQEKHRTHPSFSFNFLNKSPFIPELSRPSFATGILLVGRAATEGRPYNNAREFN
jgi:hypothetical protein